MEPTPLQLSQRLIEQYNHRDLDGMLELFAVDVAFIRPGPVVVHGRDAVRARYEQDWDVFDESFVQIQRAVCAGSEVAAEIHMTLRRDGATSEAEGAVFHLWQDGLLQRYRAYLDLAPF